jgi:exopolysaccharide biosynthesis polyprenyl glycosylphosphotransferase
MTAVMTLRETASRSAWQKNYARRLVVSDTLVVVGALALAQYVRFGRVASLDDFTNRYIFLFSTSFAVIWLMALTILRTRSTRVLGEGPDEYRGIVTATFWTFGLIAIVSLITQTNVARGYLIIALPAGCIGLLVSRWLWRRRLSSSRAKGRFQTAVVAIGSADAVLTVAHEMMRDPRAGYQVVGIGIPGYGPGRGETLTVHGNEVPILGDEVCALDLVKEVGADTVAVTGTDHFGVRGIRELMWRLEAVDVDLVVSPGVMDVAGARLSMRPVSGFPLVHVEKPQYQGAERLQKRIFDFCFALAALIGTSPLLITAALVIKRTSAGPIFYTADRIGLNGQPFKMLKFRTMVVDADKQVDVLWQMNDVQGGVLFKLRNDPRVTPIGRLLRRFSIDELPQFINVLKRDMSVVGPRPPLAHEVEKYDPAVRRRLLVKPGITGLWQVSGRSDLSWEESVRLDISYVENWSMAGDLIICGKTLKAVLGSNGAY